MRIRKNFERVVEKKSYLVCQLNRVPWEDDSFFTLGESNKKLSSNGSSSDDSLTITDSDDSMDISDDCVMQAPVQSEEEKWGELVPLEEKEITIARFSEARNRIEQALSFFSLPPLAREATVPSGTSSILPKKRGRPKKGKQIAWNSSNSKSKEDDYHYETVFRPSWSKMRGSRSRFKKPASQMDNTNTKTNTNASTSIKINGNNSNSNGMYFTGSASIARKNIIINISDDSEDDHDNKDTNNKNKTNTVVVTNSTKGARAIDETIDYIDDNDEEDWYDGGRGKKPMKARSLKSIM